MAMDLQRLMSLLRQCMQRYDMVSAGDKIAVGLSGGKDSLTLLMGLKHLQRFYPVPSGGGGGGGNHSNNGGGGGDGSGCGRLIAIAVVVVLILIVLGG